MIEIWFCLCWVDGFHCTWLASLSCPRHTVKLWQFLTLYVDSLWLCVRQPWSCRMAMSGEMSTCTNARAQTHTYVIFLSHLHLLSLSLSLSFSIPSSLPSPLPVYPSHACAFFLFHTHTITYARTLTHTHLHTDTHTCVCAHTQTSTHYLSIHTHKRLCSAWHYNDASVCVPHDTIMSPNRIALNQKSNIKSGVEFILFLACMTLSQFTITIAAKTCVGVYV